MVYETKLVCVIHCADCELLAMRNLLLFYIGSSGSTVENLFQVAEEVGKAVGSLVNIMTDDEDSPFEDDNKAKHQKR